MTLTPEKIKETRERYERYKKADEADEPLVGVRKLADIVPALLDRVEELERENKFLTQQAETVFAANKRIDERAETALSELSALKAKVERLKHHVEHYCGECQEEILSILDGKEG